MFPPQGKTLSPAPTRLPPPFPRPLPTRSVPTRASVRCVSCLRLRALPRKKSTPIFRIVARAIPNGGAATSHRTRTYRFDGDIGHIIIDVSLIRRRISTRRRSCRPQRVDLQRNSSTRCPNVLASTASPNDPITTFFFFFFIIKQFY